LQGIINDALKDAEIEKEIKKPGCTSTPEHDFDGKPRIVIIGCGGAGNNIVNRIHHMGLSGAETIAINTDKQHLDKIHADNCLLIGESQLKGLGAGGYPDIGRLAAEMARPDLEAILETVDLVFITAGMGGGTGTGSAPVVAQIAKKTGATVIGIVSYPFSIEKARIRKAEEGINSLFMNTDSLIVLDFNKLKEIEPDLELKNTFSVMDQLISETIKGICDIILQPSLININIADFNSIIQNSGETILLVIENDQNKKMEDIIKNCSKISFSDYDFQKGTSALILIFGGKDLTVEKASQFASLFSRELDKSAHIVCGARIDNRFKGIIFVIIIISKKYEEKDISTANTFLETITPLEISPSQPLHSILPEFSNDNWRSGIGSATEERIVALEKKLIDLEALVKRLFRELLDLKSVAMKMSKQTEERNRREAKRGPTVLQGVQNQPVPPAGATAASSTVVMRNGTCSADAPSATPSIDMIMQSDGTLKLEERRGDKNYLVTSPGNGKSKKGVSVKSKQGDLIEQKDAKPSDSSELSSKLLMEKRLLRRPGTECLEWIGGGESDTIMEPDGTLKLEERHGDKNYIIPTYESDLPINETSAKSEKRNFTIDFLQSTEIDKTDPSMPQEPAMEMIMQTDATMKLEPRRGDTPLVISPPRRKIHKNSKLTNKNAEFSDLHFSVTSPYRAAPGTSFVLDIWAHLGNQRDVIRDRALQGSLDDNIIMKSIGPKKIQFGTEITVRLEIPGLEIENIEQVIMWIGEIASANYCIDVPINADKGKRAGKVKIFVHGLQIAFIGFEILIDDIESSIKSAPFVTKQYKTAFVSYASPDKDKVLARIQGIQKIAPNIEIKMDIKDIRSGDNWKKKLREFIELCDIFYLFWSKNAKESFWVNKEWRCAYNLKGVDFIDPVPLEPPTEIDPPKELAEKHFNDWVLAYMSSSKL
jgi:cell division protein FtsZ